MKRNKILKRYNEGYTAQQDNTNVSVQKPIKLIKLTNEQIKNIQLRKLQKASENNQSRIYDTNQAKFYENLQNFYNDNVFGYGLFGTQTHYDPSTPEGQTAIQSNFNYSKDNALDFLQNISNVGFYYGVNSVISKFIDGIFPIPSKHGSLGTLSRYSKNPIGSGAEAIVVENTPTTVGKITSIPIEEMTARNQIPNTIKSEYIGYVKDKGVELPTYIQRKVKMLTEENFPKYSKRLDKSMQRSGYRRINDPNVQYRAYTNGDVVIDDISPNNVGLDWLGRPKMIDFNIQTVPEWIEQGFTLKRKGGKLYERLIPRQKYRQ